VHFEAFNLLHDIMSVINLYFVKTILYSLHKVFEYFVKKYLF